MSIDLKWLKNDTGKYDLIILDPPTFSNSKKMEGTMDIQRDHIAMIQNCAKRLTPDGVLIFSNNLRKFRLDKDRIAALGYHEMES